MRIGDSGRRPSRRRWLFVVGALLLVPLSLSILRVGSPELSLETDLPGIGPHTVVSASAVESGRGLGNVRLELEQNGEVRVLDEHEFVPRSPWEWWGERTIEDHFEASIGHDEIDGLEAGQATLRLVAERAGSALRRPGPVVLEKVVPVKLRPPLISVQSEAVYLRQGGSGVVVYRVDPPGARDGVEVEDRFFPGHALPGDSGGLRFAFFGAPYDLTDGSAVVVVASDDLGNTARQRFLTDYRLQPPKQSTIQLSDSFMERVVPQIAAQSDVQEGETLLDSYLAINRDLRSANDQRLIELATASRAEFLWQRPFLQQPNSQVMDAFASQRRYFYDGELVDRQTHLGYDLASRRRDEVLASNRGVVALAEYFGIYGNAVVLDHGFGLMTLYAHLSSIEVSVGESVERGQTVGRSGETGLAGGDHLHFSVLMGGLPVDALEWWDGKWIADRVADQLGTALAFER